MAQTAEQVVAQATFYHDDVDYVLVKLPANGILVAAGILAEIGKPFGALIVDKDEVTLLVDARATETFTRRLLNTTVSKKTYRLISLDVELEPELVGLIAIISRALADAEISILTFAAFSRDHLLVPTKQFDEALTALENLKSG